MKRRNILKTKKMVEAEEELEGTRSWNYVEKEN